MTETLDKKVIEKVDELLSSENVSGLFAIKKGEDPAWTRKMVDGVVDYIRSRGYDATIDEDNESYYIVPITKKS